MLAVGELEPVCIGNSCPVCELTSRWRGCGCDGNCEKLTIERDWT